MCKLVADNGGLLNMYKTEAAGAKSEVHLIHKNDDKFVLELMHRGKNG